MAEKEKNEQQAQEQAPKKKKLPIKTFLILVAVLLIEAAAISLSFMFSGGPASVRANTAAETLAAQAQKLVEVQVANDRFQNVKTGRTYLYETEIYIVVKKKYQTKVEEKVKDMAQEINTEISYIFRRAEPAHLIEPTLSTLTRQIHAKLDELLGPAEDDGKSMIEKVLISKCTQYRADL
jgi:flagellar basal body-associated protein FliL